MDKVAILMSTFNGDKYISQQLDSILNQENVDVSIFVRDDGSTDKTRFILEEYSRKNNVIVSFEKNIGWRKSFFSLIIGAPTAEYDYFALADQDDIWLGQKLKRAVDQLKKTSSTLYYSNLEMINEKNESFGKKLKDTYFAPINPQVGYFDGFPTGSTMVFTTGLLEKIQKNLLLTDIKDNSHDAFLFAASNFVGQTFYDREAFIQYRRHSNNATGFGNTSNQFHPRLLDRYKRFKRMPAHVYSDRARLLLLALEDDISEENKFFLQRIANSKRLLVRTKLFFSPKIVAKGFMGIIKIKLRILQNRF